MANGDLTRVRGLFNLPAEEAFLGGKLWGPAPVRCMCTRKGGASLWLFRHYIGLEYEDGVPPDCFHVGRVHLEPSLKVYIKGNSFSCPPECFAEMRIVPVDLSLPSSTILLGRDEAKGSDAAKGLEASKAIQFIWQANNNELSERSHVHIACNRFVDVVGVSARLPVEDTCRLITQQGQKMHGKLKLTQDGVLTFASYSRAGDKHWSLDSIIMIRKGKKAALAETIEFLELVSASQTVKWTADSMQNFSKTYDGLTRAWCLNCNSVVNYRLMNKITDEDYCPSPHIKKRDSTFVRKNHAGLEDKVCFSVDEVKSLLSAYQMMDDDQSGLISKQEWINSLGPVFRQSQTARAVFSCFDSNNDGLISFSEFLFGCRVLHLGSSKDRLDYQYRIFDPSGTGRISLAQFITVAHSLHEAVGCQPPAGSSGLEEYATQLFRRLDTQNTGEIDSEAFKATIQQDRVFSKAFQGLAEMRRRRVADSKTRTGKPVWFGDPQWLQCTAILQGISLSIDHRAKLGEARGKAPLRSEQFIPAFEERQTWELGGQREMDNDTKLPKKPHPHYEGSKPGKAVHPLVAYESYFTDYCPQVFHAIQERFGVSLESYRASLGIDQLHSSLLVGCLSNLTSVASSGRSGAFFYASHDGAFILKTIEKDEGRILQKFLPAYYDHIMQNPETLLTRYFGLHALAYGGKKMFFLVMNNVMRPPVEFPINIRYDLKGSTVGRTTPSDRRNDDVALKDQDFKRKLVIDAAMRKRFVHQLRADSELLQRSNLNDYSLLVGIHSHGTETVPHASVDPQQPFWLQYHGGIPSRDRREIYYIGIIDLLTEFGFKKKGEYTLKSLYYRKGKVSCVPPSEYRERFVQWTEYIFPCATPAWEASPQRRSLSPGPPHHLRYNPVQAISPVPFHNFAETPDMGIDESPPGSPMGLM
eukprot:TRINITY_DN24921_c0_g1_i1.p1 TRINITY_DN24921_c0_g1~~TRINITY_DN24921_c0_g1_i1.p1  ORF type:complete len:925 (+),score=273.86 TRINITY_DN24921_c0_g1_i1:100-2874(+)